MHALNRETILAVILGFVAVWFGIQEILHPASWTAFVPKFATTIAPAISLVIIHGVVLCLAGLAMGFNFYRRIAATIFALMLAHIIFILVSGSHGLDEISVRDIGLLGGALSLAWRS